MAKEGLKEVRFKFDFDGAKVILWVKKKFAEIVNIAYKIKEFVGFVD